MTTTEILETMVSILEDCVPYSLLWGFGVTIYTFMVGEITGRRHRNDKL